MKKMLSLKTILVKCTFNVLWQCCYLWHYCYPLHKSPDCGSSLSLMGKRSKKDMERSNWVSVSRSLTENCCKRIQTCKEDILELNWKIKAELHLMTNLNCIWNGLESDFFHKSFIVCTGQSNSSQSSSTWEKMASSWNMLCILGRLRYWGFRRGKERQEVGEERWGSSRGLMRGYGGVRPGGARSQTLQEKPLGIA